MQLNKIYLWIYPLLMYSCATDGFQDDGNQIKQKLVRLASGEKTIDESNHFAASISFGKTQHPPLHSFTLYHHNLCGLTESERFGDTLQSDFKKLLIGMKEGEERIFKLPFSYFDDTFLSAFADSSIAAPNEEMQITINILKTFEPGELASYLMSLAQHNEMSETEAIEWLLMNETDVDYERHGEIYLQRIRTVGSSNIHTGDTLQLTYTTHFLDGKVIDRPTHIEYIPGQSGQLVSGLAMAIRESHCGDSIRVYLPSALAFGEGGSSTGIIPPKTPLIFSVSVACH